MPHRTYAPRPSPGRAAPFACVGLQWTQVDFDDSGWQVGQTGVGYDTGTRYKTLINVYCKFASVTDTEQVSDDNVRNLFYNGRNKINIF